MFSSSAGYRRRWIPAFAGMTSKDIVHNFSLLVIPCPLPVILAKARIHRER
jgi:hypothetical protein